MWWRRWTLGTEHEGPRAENGGDGGLCSPDGRRWLRGGRKGSRRSAELLKRSREGIRGERSLLRLLLAGVTLFLPFNSVPWYPDWFGQLKEEA